MVVSLFLKSFSIMVSEKVLNDIHLVLNEFICSFHIKRDPLHSKPDITVQLSRKCLKQTKIRPRVLENPINLTFGDYSSVYSMAPLLVYYLRSKSISPLYIPNFNMYICILELI